MPTYSQNPGGSSRSPSPEPPQTERGPRQPWNPSGPSDQGTSPDLATASQVRGLDIQPGKPPSVSSVIPGGSPSESALGPSDGHQGGARNSIHLWNGFPPGWPSQQSAPPPPSIDGNSRLAWRPSTVTVVFPRQTPVVVSNAGDSHNDDPHAGSSAGTHARFTFGRNGMTVNGRPCGPVSVAVLDTRTESTSPDNQSTPPRSFGGGGNTGGDR